jgi:hypothetical protein
MASESKSHESESEIDIMYQSYEFGNIFLDEKPYQFMIGNISFDDSVSYCTELLPIPTQSELEDSTKFVSNFGGIFFDFLYCGSLLSIKKRTTEPYLDSFVSIGIVFCKDEIGMYNGFYRFNTPPDWFYARHSTGWTHYFNQHKQPQFSIRTYVNWSNDINNMFIQQIAIHSNSSTYDSINDLVQWSNESDIIMERQLYLLSLPYESRKRTKKSVKKEDSITPLSFGSKISSTGSTSSSIGSVDSTCISNISSTSRISRGVSTIRTISTISSGISCFGSISKVSNASIDTIQPKKTIGQRQSTNKISNFFHRLFGK